MKRTFSALFLALTTALTAPVFADDAHNTAPGLTAAGAPLGLHGADPVALLAGDADFVGSAAFTSTHDGVAYYFRSADNLARFEADPARYEPQYGGFCAFGVAIGKKFDGDPNHVAVRDGKLYVFLNAEILAAFEENPEATLADAEAQWPRIANVAAGAL